jgi:hypothetical protein
MNDANPREVTGLVKVDCACVKVLMLMLMFIRQCLFAQLIHQSINELNKIQSVANIELLHVSALGGSVFRELLRTKEYKPSTLIHVLYCQNRQV